MILKKLYKHLVKIDDKTYFLTFCNFNFKVKTFQNYSKLLICQDLPVYQMIEKIRRGSILWQLVVGCLTFVFLLLVARLA